MCTGFPLRIPYSFCRSYANLQTHRRCFDVYNQLAFSLPSQPSSEKGGVLRSIGWCDQAWAGVKDALLCRKLCCEGWVCVKDGFLWRTWWAVLKDGLLSRILWCQGAVGVKDGLFWRTGYCEGGGGGRSVFWVCSCIAHSSWVASWPLAM